jgi:hypothetical protein
MQLHVRRDTKALLVGLASALLSLMVLTVIAPPAGAYTFTGCEYDNNSISPISYRFFSVGSAYEVALSGGAVGWNGTSVPGYFEQQSSSWDPEINVTDGTYSGTFWAQTSWSCQSNGLYSGNEVDIRFDTEDMAGLTRDEKRLVAMHELGHAYGLGHMADGCHVMRQGRYKFTCGTMPSSDDINGVHAVY